MAGSEIQVRRADAADAAAIAQLLDDFNREYDTETPGIEVLGERVARLLATGEISVLLAEAGGGAGSTPAEGAETALPAGLSLYLLTPSLWYEGPECYLAELYVRPPLRGGGIGRALLEATIAAARETGAGALQLNTAEDDTAARGLYESLGFSNRENGPEGPAMLFYELEL